MDREASSSYRNGSRRATKNDTMYIHLYILSRLILNFKAMKGISSIKYVSTKRLVRGTQDKISMKL